MQYFKNVKDLKELKQQFRQLVLKLHPDRGGNEEQFKAMKNEFEKLLKTRTFFNNETETEEKFRENIENFEHILNKIVHLKSQGVIIEIIGTWIWCTGDTYPHKDIFKKEGFRFSGKKMAWYYHDEPYRKRSKKKFTLDEIKDMYGVIRLKEEQKKLVG